MILTKLAPADVRALEILRAQLLSIERPANDVLAHAIDTTRTVLGAERAGCYRLATTMEGVRLDLGYWSGFGGRTTIVNACFDRAVSRGGSFSAYDALLVVLRSHAARDVARQQTAVRAWRLTPREADVLALLVAGDTNRDIAMTLGIAEATVEIHVSRIFGKARVDNRAGLVAAYWQPH